MEDELILMDALGIKEDASGEAQDKTDDTEKDEVVRDQSEDNAEKEEVLKEETDKAKNDKAAPDENVENKEEKPKEESVKEETNNIEKTAISEELISALKEIDPEAEVKDQSEAISIIKERYREAREAVQRYEKNNKEIIKAIEDNPEVGDFMKAVISGMDPMVAAGIHISETLAPEDGEKGSEEYKTELAKKTEEKAKREKAMADFRSNHKASQKRAEEFVKENKLNQAEFEKSLVDFDKQISELRNGVVTKDLLSLVHKATLYDKEMKEVEKKIKEAEERGYLKGKNEKIVLKKTAKENTDGMPGLTSGTGKEKESSDPDFWDRVSRRR